MVLWETSNSMSAQSQQPQEYDLIVLGSGPAGQKAALAAAKQRCRVAIIDQRQAVGEVLSQSAIGLDHRIGHFASMRPPEN